MPSLSQPTAISEEKFCAFCGYNLHGITSTRCPECGQDIPTGLIIPWNYRKQIGNLRAFVQTVWIATFHPHKLALAAPRDGDYRAAEHFRWIISAIIGVPPSLFFIWFIDQHADDLVRQANAVIVTPIAELRILWWAGALFLPVLPLACLLTPFLVTAAATYWFGGRNLSVAHRNRAMVLSRFATAPFAWAFPLWIIFALCIPYLVRFNPRPIPGPTVSAASIPPYLVRFNPRPIPGPTVSAASIPAALLMNAGAIILLAAHRSAYILLRSSTPRSRVRLFITFIGLPLTWALALLIGMFLLPVAAGLIIFMSHDFHP
jgi:hypothetical protein